MHKAQIRGRLRSFVFQRAGFRCEYCLTPLAYTIQPFVCEHINPTIKGGANTANNLACSCGGCNGHKHDKTEAPDPVDGKMTALYNPRTDKWADHFDWNADFTHVIGLTPTGRTTVETLHLNRPGVLNIRQLLLMVGEHPPDNFGVA